MSVYRPELQAGEPMTHFKTARAKTVRAGLLAAAGCLTLTWASPAVADWRRAESDRFIVYGESSEADLRTYVQKLETFDMVLRGSMGLSLEAKPERKLPVYVVRNHRGLEAVRPGTPPQIAGFYVSGNEDIFAVAMMEGGGDLVLLHEYGHHFMYQNFAAAYPGWFIEGFAEYYATADIRSNSVSVGEANADRAYWLFNGVWVPLEELLSKRPSEVTRRTETYYPLSWLLTHWFLSDTARRQQLGAYLTDINDGGDPVEAMQRATGMDITTLTRTLRGYSRGGLAYRRINYEFPRANVTITTLPRSADRLLLLGQALKRNLPEDDEPGIVAEARQAAARFPNDPLAQLVLGRAELTAGDPDAAETVLDALLQAQPNNVEALQLMARVLMTRADALDDDTAREAQQRAARSYLGRAFAQDDANFTTFLMLAESRQSAATYPNDNDIHTLRLAVQLAPQLPDARLNLAAALIYRGEDPEVIRALLRPAANDPHNAGLAAAAQQMIEQAQSAAGSRSILNQMEALAESEPEPPVEPTEAP